MRFDVSLEEHRSHAQLEIAKRKEQTNADLDAAALAEKRELLAEVVLIEDASLLDDLIAIGFDAETVGVLPLVPLICVAWADGEVSRREAKSILDLATERGVASGSPAYTMLDAFLQEEPESDYLHSCLYVLREVYDSLAPDEMKRAKKNLLGFSYVVARASGGVLGLFGNKVSEEEQKLIEEMADLLGVSRSGNAAAVQRLVAEGGAGDEDAEAAEDAPKDE